MQATALRRASALALILALGGLGGCGGDDEPAAEQATTPAPAATEPATDEAATAGGEELELTAVEEGGLAFDPAELTAKAGTVTLTLDNPEGNTMPHAVEIEGNGVEEESDTIQGGNTASVTVDLKAGEYVYYCPVGQHRQNGMEGTLTVE